jgi:DNA primase
MIKRRYLNNTGVSLYDDENMAQKTIRTHCPKCHGHSYVITPKNGLSFCFLCRYWERDGDAPVQSKVRSQYINEIRNLYTQAAHYYHSSLTTEAITFLHTRGVTDQTIQDALLGYCPVGKSPLYKGTIAVEAGLGLPHDESGVLAGRITLPYFRDAGVVSDIRGRSITPNEEIKYKSLYNHAFFRGADYPFNYHVRDNKRIILTEGELKAILATQYGYTALALPGMTSWKDGFTQQEDQHVVIIFDSQVKNALHVRDAIIRAASKLNNVYIGTLPLFGKQKMDIDQLILEHGIDIFRDVVNNALPYQIWLQLTERF